MRSRFRRSLVVLAMVLWSVGMVAPVEATTTVNIGKYAQYFTYQCATGHLQPSDGPGARCALEFKVGLPNGGKVIRAVFSIQDYDEIPCDPCPVDFYGYVGNGHGDPDDLTAGSKLATRDMSGSPRTVSFDVTDFVAGIVNDGHDFAGIRISSPPTEVANNYIHWESGSANIELEYALTIPMHAATSGTGKGSIVSKPAGINCTTECVADFEIGTPITFTAKPASGSRFAGWTDQFCKGQGATCTFEVPVAENWVLAKFEKITAAPSGAPATPTPAPSSTAEPTDEAPLSEATAAPSSGLSPSGLKPTFPANESPRPSQFEMPSPTPSALTESPASAVGPITVGGVLIVAVLVLGFALWRLAKRANS